MNKKGQDYAAVNAMEYAFLVILAIFFSVAAVNGVEEQKINQFKADNLAMAIDSAFLLKDDAYISYNLGKAANVKAQFKMIEVYESDVNKMGKKEEVENKKSSTLLTDKIAEASDKMIGGLKNMFMYFSDYKKEERRAEKDWRQKQVEQWQRTYKNIQEQWKNDVEEWQHKMAQWKQERRDNQYEKYLELEKRIRQMPIYERWRQDVMKKCENKCQICGSNKKLEVHHLDSFYSILKQNNIDTIEKAFECKQLWDIDNGEVLCKECHDKMESSKNRQAILTRNDK